MHEYYRYIIRYCLRGTKKLRRHESCLFLSLDECQQHMNRMVIEETLCKMDEVVFYSIESMIADPTTVPAAEVFGF